jgi:Protein of unknown function (DUF2505)
MRFEHHTTYAAGATRVLAMLADPAFRTAVSRRQGALSHDVRIEGVPGVGAGMAVQIDQVLPTQGVPPAAAKFVGEEIRVSRSESWREATWGQVEIAIPGKPGQLVGTLTLTESAGQTTLALDSDLTVAIPFIGAKLEALVGDLFRRALDAEAEVAGSWLADPA